MNIDAINEDPLLKGTPIGGLKVVQMRGWVGVAVVDRFGGERIIHELAEGSTVLDAVYGKRPFEAEAIREIAARNKAREEEQEARASRDEQGDFVRDLGKSLQNDENRDALLRGTSR